MNILYVTSYPLEYNSSANIRNWGLIEGLLENGHEISTLSPYPMDQDYFNGKVLSSPFKKRYWVGAIANTKEVSRAKSFFNNYKSRIKSIVYKIYNYFSVYDRRSLLASKINVDSILETFDLVISSSDPKSAHIFASKLFSESPTIAKKWIQYWGDPFSNDISFRRFFGNFFVNREEKRLLGLADKAVFVSPFTANALKAKYPQYHNKIQFLPIPYRISKVGDKNDVYETGLIGYFGDYNSNNRNIMPLYQTLKSNGYRATIIGNSDVLLESSELIQVGRRVPTEQLTAITNRTHVFVCVCNLHGTQIPGKVYHYVNSGRPIVIVLDGENKKEMSAYFESFKRFYLCDNTVDSINDCLKKAVSDNKVFGVPDALNPVIISNSFVE